MNGIELDLYTDYPPNNLNMLSLLMGEPFKPIQTLVFDFTSYI